MTDQNPPKPKKQGKNALKQGVELKYLTRAKPVWIQNVYWSGWSGWFADQLDEGCPFVHLGFLMREHEKTLPGFDPRGAADSWMPFMKEKRNAGLKLVQVNRDWARDGTHYWLSGLIEWFGYSVYSFVWKQTELSTRGTELSFPHRQRIEKSDADRYRKADRAAEAAELAWTSRFP